MNAKDRDCLYCLIYSISRQTTTWSLILLHYLSMNQSSSYKVLLTTSSSSKSVLSAALLVFDQTVPSSSFSKQSIFLEFSWLDGLLFFFFLDFSSLSEIERRKKKKEKKTRKKPSTELGWNGNKKRMQIIPSIQEIPINFAYSLVLKEQLDPLWSI